MLFIVRVFIPLFPVSRTFLKELEAYTDCPELVGRCFLERVSTFIFLYIVVLTGIASTAMFPSTAVELVLTC